MILLYKIQKLGRNEGYSSLKTWFKTGLDMFWGLWGIFLLGKTWFRVDLNMILGWLRNIPLFISYYCGAFSADLKSCLIQPQTMFSQGGIFLKSLKTCLILSSIMLFVRNIPQKPKNMSSPIFNYAFCEEYSSFLPNFCILYSKIMANFSGNG